VLCGFKFRTGLHPVCNGPTVEAPMAKMSPLGALSGNGNGAEQCLLFRGKADIACLHARPLTICQCAFRHSDGYVRTCAFAF
jgi:hypothetical protein